MPSQPVVTRGQMAERLLAHLARIRILPRALLLETPGVRANVPMLRGTWGAALHDLDRDVYESVFHPRSQGEAHGQVPTYVLRPAPPHPVFAPAVEWVLIGDSAIGHDVRLLLAWGMAMQRGLGKSREPFFVRHIAGLDPGGQLTDQPAPWTLDQIAWPLSGDPSLTPCRLAFYAPLSLFRDHRLIQKPTLADLVIRGVKRIAAFLPEEVQETWYELRGEAIELARRIPAEPWRGQRLDLQRYSSSQDQEFEVHGVCGYLDLPEGPHALWPLLAALQWLHVGKSTVVGLGQVYVEANRTGKHA